MCQNIAKMLPIPSSHFASFQIPNAAKKRIFDDTTRASISILLILPHPVLPYKKGRMNGDTESTKSVWLLHMADSREEEEERRSKVFLPFPLLFAVFYVGRLNTSQHNLRGTKKIDELLPLWRSCWTFCLQQQQWHLHFGTSTYSGSLEEKQESRKI